MNQIVQFGQRYGKWIAIGFVSVVAVVGSVAAYRAYYEEDDYTETDEGEDATVEDATETDPASSEED